MTKPFHARDLKPGDFYKNLHAFQGKYGYWLILVVEAETKGFLAFNPTTMSNRWFHMGVLNSEYEEVWRDGKKIFG